MLFGDIFICIYIFCFSNILLFLTMYFIDIDGHLKTVQNISLGKNVEDIFNKKSNKIRQNLKRKKIEK